MSRELLAGFPVVVEIPVQWGELDAYGHVNNTVLFRYFESARVAYLERCGFIESYDRDKIGAILHSTGCRFRRAFGTVSRRSSAPAAPETTQTLRSGVYSPVGSADGQVAHE